MAEGSNGNGNGTTANIAKLVKAEFTQGLSRAFIVLGVPIIVALLGFFGNRVVAAFDTFNASIAEVKQTLADQRTAVGVLQNSMTLRGNQRDEQVGDIRKQLGDHESRIRVLERPTRVQ